MAVASLGLLGTGSSKSAATTLNVTNTTGAIIPAGVVIHITGAWDNIASVTAPTITCSAVGGGTAIANHATAIGSGVTTTAGSGVWHQCFRVRTVSSIASGAVIATLTSNQSAVVRAAHAQGFTGVTTTLRDTVTTAVSTTGVPSVTTTGTALVAGDLVIGSVSNENNAQMTADADTLNGSWTSIIGIATTGSTAATNQNSGSQAKIVTATGAQTYNPTGGVADTVACVYSLQPVLGSGLIGTTGDFASSGTFTLVTWNDMPVAQAGDLALLFWTHSDTSTETTPPSGFTKYGQQLDDSVIHSLYYRVCTGTESGTISYALDGATRTTTVVLLIRGWTLDAVVSVGDTGTDANHTAPNVTPTASGAAVIISNGERLTTGSSTTTPPGGYTLARQEAAVGSGGSFTGVAYEGSGGVFTGGHASGVAVSPGTMVNNVAAAAVALWSIALIPPGAPVLRPRNIRITNPATPQSFMR